MYFTCIHILTTPSPNAAVYTKCTALHLSPERGLTGVIFQDKGFWKSIDAFLTGRWVSHLNVYSKRL